MLRLALPLILAELAWLSMGIVDTNMVGHLANSTLVAQSFGAGNLEDCHKSLWNMIYLTLPLAPVLMMLVEVSLYLLHGFGINPGVESVAELCMRVLLWQ